MQDDNLVVKTFKEIQEKLNSAFEKVEGSPIKDYISKTFSDGFDHQIIIHSDNENTKSK
jgi:hypothetical protein